MGKLKTNDHLVGQTINFFKILEARPNGQKGMVLAECVCGKRIVTRARSIKNSISKSCGCKRKEYSKRGKRLTSGNTAINKLYSQYRTKARNQGKEFSLTIEQFVQLTSSNCYYCEDIPSAIYKTKYDQYPYNGIDRVDNSKGYSIENSAPCCYQCNTNKGGVTLQIIEKMIRFLNGTKSV